MTANPDDAAHLRISRHQRKVLVAIHALEERCGERWWSTYHIGQVVCAGGYHQSIQLRTMAALRQAGLVLVQYETLPAEVRAHIHCDCYCNRWGLTDDGRRVAERTKCKTEDIPNHIFDWAMRECVNMAKATMKRISDPDFKDDDGYEYVKWTRRR